MTNPDPGQQEPKVLPGYFSPAATPPQYVQPQVPAPPAPQYQEPRFQQPLNHAAQMPAPVQPYTAPPMQYVPAPFGASDPESLPLYAATLFQSVGRFFRKYATFTGRASRAEFWFVQLFMAVAFFALAVISSVIGSDAAAMLVVIGWFGTLVPWLALSVRRLHDANLSGGLVALWLVPYVGFAVVLVLALLAPKPEGARFDKRAAAPAAYGQAPNGGRRF